MRQSSSWEKRNFYEKKPKNLGKNALNCFIIELRQSSSWDNLWVETKKLRQKIETKKIETKKNETKKMFDKKCFKFL